jgi:putative FmdB family regulatory protein
MPLYDYRCANGHTFEARHGFAAAAPDCPVCGASAERIITQAPAQMHGMAAAVSKNADKAELRAKWDEETPRLREQLVRKLGEETVARNAPTLGSAPD